MPFLELKKRLAADIAGAFKLPELSEVTIFADLAAPPNPQMGHIALPCFRISKILKKPADQVAAELCSKLSNSDLGAQPAGPYANFRWPTSLIFNLTIARVLSEQANYGNDPQKPNSTIVIEYCSTNIAKPLGFQHIRTTLIGHVLANIYKAKGYQVTRINFLGDWGAQFAKLLAAFQLWGDRTLLDTPKAMSHLMEVYVRFHKELEIDPSINDKAVDWLKRLEAKDNSAWDLWKTIRDISVSKVNETLQRLNVTFDHAEGESQYIDAIESTLSELKDKAGAKISEGAWIVELDGISVPALIQKRDGTTLYLTRDIAAAIDRYQRFHFSKMLYVVSDQQRLHFQQLFGTLKKMTYAWANSLEHVGYGTVLFGQEKMSTREGRVILLDDILNQATELALLECTKKNPNLKDKESVAQIVGIGAVIFGQLSSHRTRDINFKWEEVLALDGETGPYVQYACVRCKSLLEKAKNIQGLSSDSSAKAFAPEEDALLLQIARFRSELERAAREYEPFYLTSYLIDLAKAFNRFYLKLPVVQCADSDTRSMRIRLVNATQITLENGLRLLGMSCPNEM